MSRPKQTPEWWATGGDWEAVHVPKDDPLEMDHWEVHTPDCFDPETGPIIIAKALCHDDAVLCAASKMLLAALESAVSELLDTAKCPSDQPVIVQAEQAIARAKGGSDE